MKRFWPWGWNTDWVIFNVKHRSTHISLCISVKKLARNVETKAANLVCRWLRKCVEVTCGVQRPPSELLLTRSTPHGWGSRPLHTGSTCRQIILDKLTQLGPLSIHLHNDFAATSNDTQATVNTAAAVTYRRQLWMICVHWTTPTNILIISRPR